DCYRPLGKRQWHVTRAQYPYSHRTGASAPFQERNRAMPGQAISSLPSNASRVVALRAVPAGGVSEPLGALPADVATIVTRVAGCKRRVRQGDFLFHSGAQFHHLFVVRAGMFKTILIDPQGREQVTGFQMAGEVLGLDGIETE